MILTYQKILHNASNVMDENLKGKWKPNVSPSCANFVAEVLKRSGIDLKSINSNWVQDYRKIFKIPEHVGFGDLVIFNRTYDVELPEGLGCEDTETHIGIHIDPLKFYHYSNSKRSVIIQKYDEYWLSKIGYYLRVP